MSIKVTRRGNILKAYGRVFRQEMQAGVEQAAVYLQGKVRASITAKRLIDTGNLRNSIQVDIKRSPSTIVGIVGTNVGYALPLEMGIQKRFFPSNEMVESITKWAQRKGISPKGRSKGIQKLSFSIGRAIAYKIARKGLDPRRFPSYFFSEATDDAKKGIAMIIENAFRRATERAGREGAR